MANQAERQAADKGARKGGGRGIMVAILMVPVLGVLFPSCIVLASGMAPSLVAYVVDKSAGRHLAITVGLLNFCGSLPGLADLWIEGQTISMAMKIAFDPLHWLAAYGAASLGWLIFLGLPLILKSYYTRTAVARIDGLRQKQAVLVRTWGEEVSGGASGGTEET